MTLAQQTCNASRRAIAPRSRRSSAAERRGGDRGDDAPSRRNASTRRPPRRSPRSSSRSRTSRTAVDAANAAVTTAQAHVDELRAHEPRVSEALRASNVADGLGLRQRWRAARRGSGRTTIPFGTAGLPERLTPEGQAVEAELRALDDTVDALADLLTAESVHQPCRATRNAPAPPSTRSRAGTPRRPTCEVVRTPRSGTAVTHRLLVLADAPAGTGWPTDATQVRAKVEPALEAWAGSLLGPASRVRIRVRSGTTVSTSDLSVLKLSALDALALTPAGGPAGATEIEQALIARLGGGARAGPRPGVDAGPALARRVPRVRPRRPRAARGRAERMAG